MSRNPGHPIFMTDSQLPPVADAATLTNLLRKAGVLDAGAVREVTLLHARDTVLSRIIRIGLRYVGDAAGAPSSLLLKMPNSGLGKSFANGGRHEVAFYTRLAPAMPRFLVPRCFDGRFDEDTFAWHLLLEDLTDTHHIATTWPVPPSTAETIAIVRALASMHAAWWDDARLGQSIGTWLDQEATAQDNAKFAGHFARFADHLGDRLDAERRDIYERLIDQFRRLDQRYHTRRHMSITHGDAHVWNFLLPRNAGADTVRIFDFDLWSIGVPTHDLAYMMALHWYPDRRRTLEEPLLDIYHAALLGHGVEGYDRDALAQDYRWSVLWHITKPVWQWTGNIPPVIWWNNLERIFMAVGDLDCRELLD